MEIKESLLKEGEEKLVLMDMGLATDDIDQQIKKLLQEHSSI
jgi:hypothetical protein